MYANIWYESLSRCTLVDCVSKKGFPWFQEDASLPSLQLDPNQFDGCYCHCIRINPTQARLPHNTQSPDVCYHLWGTHCFSLFRNYYLPCDSKPNGLDPDFDQQAKSQRRCRSLSIGQRRRSLDMIDLPFLASKGGCIPTEVNGRGLSKCLSSFGVIFCSACKTLMENDNKLTPEAAAILNFKFKLYSHGGRESSLTHRMKHKCPDQVVLRRMATNRALNVQGTWGVETPTPLMRDIRNQNQSSMWDKAIKFRPSSVFRDVSSVRNGLYTSWMHPREETYHILELSQFTEEDNCCLIIIFHHIHIPFKAALFDDDIKWTISGYW